MASICRLCAAVRKTEMLTNITDVNHDICQKLRQVFQVVIRLDDALPKCVCRDCVKALLQAYDFYVKVQESQESLASLFSPNAASQDSDTTVLVVKNAVTAKASHKSKAENDLPASATETELCESSEEDTVMSAVLKEDEVDMILEKDLEVELEDEVYLIEKILGRKCREDDAEFSDDTETISTAGLKSPESVESNDKQLEQDHSVQTTASVADFDSDDDVILVSGGDQLQNDGNTNSSGHIETWSTYPWQCYLCVAEKRSFIDLLLHLQVAHDVQSEENVQFKCVDCQKNCTRYYGFINHVRLQHRHALALCCDICNNHCIDFKHLALHRREQHSLEVNYPQVMLCDNCGRGFSSQNSLKIHSKIHRETKDVFECNVCGKKFKRAKGLKMHQSVHSDSKDFSCKQCGKSFRQKVNLESHMLAHMDDKPYQCQQCHKNFKTPSSLNKHNAIHTDVKKFKCDFCGKLFRTKDAKFTHERIHTGEMPFKCLTCARSFRFRGIYLAHLNIHTGNRPYSCLACDHHFTNWSNYNKHMKRRHADEYVATSKRKNNSLPSKQPKDIQPTVEGDLEERLASPASATGISDGNDNGLAETSTNLEAGSVDEAEVRCSESSLMS